MSDLKASIIIPTLDREPIVLKTLEHLKTELDDSIECIIVDSSETPSALLEEFKSEISNYKYLHLTERGLPRARNFGIESSKGEIIIFIDDDVIPKKGFVKNHLENYKDPEIIAVGGKVIENSNIFNTGGKSLGGKINYYGKSIRNFESDNYGETEWGAGCNFSFRRSLLVHNIKFDISYAGTTLLEEADFFEQIRRISGKIVYDPKSELTHLRAQMGGCREPDRNIREYWRYHNTTLFFLKHRSIIYFPLFIIYYAALLQYNVLQGNIKLSNFFKIFKGVFTGISTFRKIN